MLGGQASRIGRPVASDSDPACLGESRRADKRARHCFVSSALDEGRRGMWMDCDPQAKAGPSRAHGALGLRKPASVYGSRALACVGDAPCHGNPRGWGVDHGAKGGKGTQNLSGCQGKAAVLSSI
jgi:hypothetical protein